MAPRGIAEFYYTATLPPRAIPIARIDATASTPAQMVDVFNTPLSTPSLGVWKADGAIAAPADFMAPDLGQAIAISGAAAYQLQNQFFEITSQVAGDGTPLFYFHRLPGAVLGATVLTLGGVPLSPAPALLLQNNIAFHSLGATPCLLRYVWNGKVETVLLQANRVMTQAGGAEGLTVYGFSGSILTVPTTGSYSLRFTQTAGYQVLPPYRQLSNVPWFPRVRYGLQPVPPEYMHQIWQPQYPYQLAAWVPGVVLSGSILEFERKQAYYDPQHLPDVLVFDQNHALKFALEGTAPGAAQRRGTAYPWKRGQIRAFDPNFARVQVAVTVEPTDICYAFYAYREPDFVLTGLDVNPFTNPALQNTTVCFYLRTDSDPLRSIYYQVFDENGPVRGLTNDPLVPNDWTRVQFFSQLTVGASFSLSSFSVTDIRVQGGGLAPAYQSRPEAANFFDLGYLDGRPYPSGGALVVYLPVGMLEQMTRAQVQAKVDAAIPMGSLAVVRYYDPSGNESL